MFNSLKSFKIKSIITILTISALFIVSNFMPNDAIAQKRTVIKLSGDSDGLSDLSDKKDKSMFVGLGTGYFMPMGDIGAALKPGIAVRGMYQYNGLFTKYFGLEFEIGYSDLKDKEYDGDIRFIWAVPSVMCNYALPKDFLLQAKLGTGFSSVKSKQIIDDKDYGESSTDMTLAIGLAVMYNFKKIYSVGLEGRYYTFFETLNGSTLGIYLLFGVRI